MEYLFREKLSLDELIEAEKFYNSLELVTIEQHPRWNEILDNTVSLRYFISRLDSQINCFAIITEKRYLFINTADISFGPLFRDPDSLIASIIAIKEFYKINGFSYLSIQLALPTGSLSEYIEYKLNQRFTIKYEFDRRNWSSLILNLSDSLDSILRNFSKGHKSAIKKSILNGIVARKINSLSEVEYLAKIYLKMNKARNLPSTDWEQISNLFNSLYAFLEREQKGFFLAVFDEMKVMTGGIIVIFQGNTARYYKGTSDPDRKDISILHVALFEAFRISKENGCKYFDLWGYNHFVNESDQVYYVNRFKKGFTDNFLFYPKLMHIPLRSIGYFLYMKVMANKNRLKFRYLSI